MGERGFRRPMYIAFPCPPVESSPAVAVVLPGFFVVEELRRGCFVCVSVYDVEELRYVFPSNDCLVEVSLLLGNNTLRLGFHFTGERFIAGDECVRPESSRSGRLAGVLLSLDLVGSGVGVRCLVPRSGMVEVLAARCREMAGGFVVFWWMDMCFGVVDCGRRALVLGQGSMGCVLGRCSFMDVFYCGSSQSLGAMVLPLAVMLPFSPNSGGGFGDDGGGRRAVSTCGADPNATARVLLRSLKPSLHANVDCTALFAAIAGVKRDTKVRLGAWSWDTATGEELRVGAGLAEPYDAVWCAVEYYEATGSILCMLFQNGYTVSGAHLGRTLVHHAILSGSAGAVHTLLVSGADSEAPVKTSRSSRSRAVHLAARLGQPEILQTLLDKGCDMNIRADAGDSAAILCSRHKREDCLRVLVTAGADVALLNSAGESPASVASSGGWNSGFERAVLGAIRSGTIPSSSDRNMFSPLTFAARCGDAAAMEVLLAQPGVDVDEQDLDGCSPIMAAAKVGNVEAFRALVFAGANVKLSNKRGETAIGLAQQSKKRDFFEQVMLEFAQEKGMPEGFYALHCASRRGDTAAVRHLASTGCDANIPDGDGHTPLMLAAREGHAGVCELLISYGARCDLQTPRGETTLSLARAALATVAFNMAEDVIMDELGRQAVLQGARVRKHTKGGRGRPHGKPLRMVAAAGVLRWGGSSRRNVICREAEVGGSSAFQRHRQRKGDAYEHGLFRVVTATGRRFFWGGCTCRLFCALLALP
ncbi:unnamed protein product [Miscanthus lutarioriparius]|uniref:Uncharacterized protein n=1 Tax=Miscanthus lutarioriparius TaxID=422564 RepID=A0A811PKH5_9POAL|nr:unnamed protein product [Miscanthus lutarioriparius]